MFMYISLVYHHRSSLLLVIIVYHFNSLTWAILPFKNKMNEMYMCIDNTHLRRKSHNIQLLYQWYMYLRLRPQLHSIFPTLSFNIAQNPHPFFPFHPLSENIVSWGIALLLLIIIWCFAMARGPIPHKKMRSKKKMHWTWYLIRYLKWLLFPIDIFTLLVQVFMNNIVL